MSVILENLSFCWPGKEKPLFDNISLAVPSGQISCLLGTNGAGKTTLMELMLGWRKPDSGRILTQGMDVRDIPTRERGRKMALVPQDERLPFAYSVLEYVLLGRAAYLSPLASPGKADIKLAVSSLEQVGISELKDRPVPELSGGELRLVLIARALVQEPEILFLDEPANHLDPGNRERVTGILQSLRESGITMIISSHEPEIVLRLAENVVLLHPGESPETGKAQDLLTSEKLSLLYNVPVTITEVGTRRVILWGK